MVVYNVGDMKRRGSPAIKHGSSDSVTETGAQQGKSSSTATIRRTEGNGQEKSSGRASAENVGKIERRSPPSFNGSSNSVDETGARRGKSSSTVTIRQTEGNSQEKSSGRARDTAARRRMSAEERKNTPPELGDADTVFVDENGVSMTYDSNDAAQFNPEGKTQDELLRDIMDSAEPLDRRYLYFGRFTDSFRIAMEKAGVEVKNLPVIMSYRDAYLAMESRENGRYQGGNINYHNLGIEGMKRAMENIGKPDAVIKSKKDGKIELFLDFVDYKGNRGLAIVQLDSNAQHSQEFIRANIVTSIYGRSRGDAYLEKAKSEGRLVYSKEEGPAQGMAQVQYKSDINADPSSMNTIRRTERNSQANISGWIVRNGKKQTVSHNAETADRDRVKNKETSNYTRKYAARLARSSFPFGNLFAVKIIGVEERKSQESLPWGRKRNVIRKQAHTGLE